MILTKPIPGFENYFVQNDGKIINVNTGREMTLSPTIKGDMTVGLVRDGYQYRRSVKVLVAEAFVPGKTLKDNTPMLYNGNKADLRASNICWRPRWLAWRYGREISNPNPAWETFPVREIRSGKIYRCILDAAMDNGVLCSDIVMSIYNDTFVYPTASKFAYV